MTSLLQILKGRARVGAHHESRDIPARTAGPVDFRQLRAPLTETDRVLVSETHLWLRKIPGRLHPKQLCRFYPRVANRLARAWDDPAAFQRLIGDLLVDRRGGRAGFPPRIVVELQVIGQYRQRQTESWWRQRLRR